MNDMRKKWLFTLACPLVGLLLTGMLVGCNPKGKEASGEVIYTNPLPVAFVTRLSCQHQMGIIICTVRAEWKRGSGHIAPITWSIGSSWTGLFGKSTEIVDSKELLGTGSVRG